MIYRQFSITLVLAMALSLIVALILTPALCALILNQTLNLSVGPYGLTKRLSNLKSIYQACSDEYSLQ